MERKRIFHRPDALVIKHKIKKLIGNLFTYSLLIIISFIILFPFISKISASFMSVEDMFDRTVNFVPRRPTLHIWQGVIEQLDYGKTAAKSILLALVCAIPQTFICAMTGYALAKMKNRLSRVVMGLVILTVLIPPQIIMVPLYLKFRFFDMFGILQALTGSTINLLNTGNGYIPFLVLSFTGTAFKNGLYIFIFRQFFMGIPEELEEAAFIDGCREFMTFIRVVLPISVPTMITVFAFSFAWQMTDRFYSGIFLKGGETLSMSVFIMELGKVMEDVPITESQFYQTAIIQTGVLLSILPLIVLYIFLQKWIIAGIERSGITG